MALLNIVTKRFNSQSNMPLIGACEFHNSLQSLAPPTSFVAFRERVVLAVSITKRLIHAARSRPASMISMRWFGCIKCETPKETSNAFGGVLVPRHIQTGPRLCAQLRAVDQRRRYGVAQVGCACPFRLLSCAPDHLSTCPRVA